MSDPDVWFVYTRTPGRLSAMPANWKGWLALILIITVPTGLLMAATPWLRDFGPAATFLGLSIVLTFDFTVLLVLIRRKGQPAKR